jgi:hypothetical protein
MQNSNDRTFKQAMQELINKQFAEQTRQELEQRLDFLEKGFTVAEATADIPNPHLRKAVADSLLYVYALSLGKILYQMDVLNQQQADELHQYISKGLAPQKQSPTKSDPDVLLALPTFIEVEVFAVGALGENNGQIYALPAIPRQNDLLVLAKDDPFGAQISGTVDKVIFVAHSDATERRRTYIQVYLSQPRDSDQIPRGERHQERGTAGS